jgi:hypothetical protein
MTGTGPTGSTGPADPTRLTAARLVEGYARGSSRPWRWSAPCWSGPNASSRW